MTVPSPLDEVRAQYESLPYPARDPRDEAIRLITGTPSHVLEINHYLFAGRLNFARPFRALVAGGGTGDACIMLAQQLADRVAVMRGGVIVAEGSPAELIHAVEETEVRWHEAGEEIVIRTTEPTRVLHEAASRALAEGRELDGLEVRRPSLEDVYLDLIGGDPADQPESEGAP